MTSTQHCDQLLEIFNRLFQSSLNTVLVKGAQEPFYQAGDAQNSYHQVMFTRDYFSSALHEIAHWCVAGAERRKLDDYGYWYAPDGRTAHQQAEFERVEVYPQALEWLFSQACGIKFRVSADNLTMGLGASEGFKDAIYAKTLELCTNGLNARAEAFLQALSEYYGSGDCMRSERYLRSDLDG